jgi:hypothetical protein
MLQIWYRSSLTALSSMIATLVITGISSSINRSKHLVDDTSDTKSLGASPGSAQGGRPTKMVRQLHLLLRC